ncbi:DUF1996 domain-containing protein [Nonomuraea sp. SYSU D8015]|uniref:DUF1996 domain-containing protein n=1 Tax=Nonomuraea sp. SYSU D8015 TaxID=2593644 RepID=UPI001660BD6C|nr:DUF1996 domain-containing protein [Nonomuraea sp. SYSU D8015]
MRNLFGGRSFGPWRGAVYIGGSIAIALAGAPLSAHAGTAAAQTIVCPNVADRLPEIPAAAKAEVDRNLAQLDQQIKEANDKLARSSDQGPEFFQNAILKPLEDKRVAAINRIATAIGREGEQPTGLDSLAPCSMSDSASPAPSGNGTASPSPSSSSSKKSSPTPSKSGTASPSPSPTGTGAGAAQTITCPNVAEKLPEIPADAKAEVDRNLAQLDQQIEEANNRLARSSDQGPEFFQNSILKPLEDKRVAAINRIATAIGRVAERPTGLDSLATCSLGNGATNGGNDDGLTAADYVDIKTVPVSKQPQATDSGSAGTFLSRCGTSSDEHSNTDNIITAPGVTDGAQAQYDYVGNTSTDALSTNESLAEADTTCSNQSDRSAYFWPTLRILGDDSALDAPGDNAGQPVEPSTVRIEYRGNPKSEVTAMPQFLRMLSGDPRAASKGGKNARATWTCSGFTNRVTDKYPICPAGSELMRVFDMPSCWDGEDIDSADRTHLAFPDESGTCPSGMEAVPQLRITLTYDDVPNTAPEGKSVPFAVDSLASEQNSPNTDHAGSVVVMSEELMNKVVQCINNDRRC